MLLKILNNVPMVFLGVMVSFGAYSMTRNDSLTNTRFLNFYVPVLIVNQSTLRNDSN